MAYKLSYEDRFGQTHTDAYHRVIEVNCNWVRETARAVVAIYVNKDARDNGKQPIGEVAYTFPTEAVISIDEETQEEVVVKESVSFTDVFGDNLDGEGVNPRKAVYSYMKENDYADAVVA